MSDNITLPREVAYEVPLHELLESVPLDARLVIDDADGKGTRFIPVGRACREAATALRAALAAPRLAVTVDPRLTPDEAAAISSALAAPKQEPVAYFDLQKQVFFWAKPTMIDVPMTVALNPLPLYAALAAPRPEPVFDGQSGHPVMLPRAPEPVLGLISDEVRAALKAADAVESQEAYRTRTPAAAPEKRHPGYVIGNHWLETAYSRVCAGEAEADVLRDIGLVRVTDAEALRRDAESWRKSKEKYTAWQKGTDLLETIRLQHTEIERLKADNDALRRDAERWKHHRSELAASLGMPRELVDAIIDAAMKGDKT